MEVFGEAQTPFVYLLKSELNLEGSIFVNAPLAMPVELFNATLLDTEFTWLEVRRVAPMCTLEYEQIGL